MLNIPECSERGGSYLFLEYGRSRQRPVTPLSRTVSGAWDTCSLVFYRSFLVRGSSVGRNVRVCVMTPGTATVWVKGHLGQPQSG